MPIFVKLPLDNTIHLCYIKSMLTISDITIDNINPKSSEYEKELQEIEALEREYLKPRTKPFYQNKVSGHIVFKSK